MSTSTYFINICMIPIEKLIKILDFIISNCVFCFNKKLYKQLKGAVMGSPASSVIATSTWNTLNP